MILAHYENQGTAVRRLSNLRTSVRCSIFQENICLLRLPITNVGIGDIYLRRDIVMSLYNATRGFITTWYMYSANNKLNEDEKPDVIYIIAMLCRYCKIFIARNRYVWHKKTFSDKFNDAYTCARFLVRQGAGVSDNSLGNSHSIYRWIYRMGCLERDVNDVIRLKFYIV